VKNIMALLLLLAALPAWAGPYFRLIDPLHPKTTLGGFYDPTGKEGPAYGTTVAIVTHSTQDGSLLKIIQEDWVPLGVGGGYSAGAAFMALGPSANLAPVAKGALLALVEKVTAEGSYQNVKDYLSPPKDSKPDISMAMGPAFSFKPVEGGDFLPVGRWRGAIRLFAGAAWVW
jgi:hypothetical protein